MNDIVVGVLIAATVVTALAFPVAYKASEADVTFTVTDKERVVTNEDSYYLVFTDTEVFSNKDSFVFSKFRSSDLQGHMEVGMTCDGTVAGWRIPLLSAYRNVIGVDCSWNAA